MSGGHFNYKQYAIREIIDSIENELERQGQVVPKDKYNRYFDEEEEKEEYYYTYPKGV